MCEFRSYNPVSGGGTRGPRDPGKGSEDEGASRVARLTCLNDEFPCVQKGSVACLILDKRAGVVQTCEPRCYKVVREARKATCAEQRRGTKTHLTYVNVIYSAQTDGICKARL